MAHSVIRSSNIFCLKYYRQQYFRVCAVCLPIWWHRHRPHHKYLCIMLCLAIREISLNTLEMNTADKAWSPCLESTYFSPISFGDCVSYMYGPWFLGAHARKLKTRLIQTCVHSPVCTNPGTNIFNAYALTPCLTHETRSVAERAKMKKRRKGRMDPCSLLTDYKLKS